MAKIIESELIEVFAVRMREERKHLNLSQEELAFRAGLDRTYISGCERQLRNPSLISIEKIAIALQISPSKLLNKKNK